MERGKPCIEALIRRLLNPVYMFRCFLSTRNESILDGFEKGDVSEHLLIALIKRSLICPYVRIILPDILYLTYTDSITDKVLYYCLHYPGQYRKTLLVQLAHMWLRPNQLELLNTSIDTPEAFCKLLVMYADSTNCTPLQFSEFLTNNYKRMHEVDCTTLVDTHCSTISLEKRALLQHFVDTLGPI